MQKITILSSVHIGNGLKYPNYVIFNGKKYNFDDIISTSIKKFKDKILSDSFLNKIVYIKNAGEAKKEISRLFNLLPEEFAQLKEEYNVSIKTPKLNELDVFEHIKNINGFIIPGSSIKGYIINVLMFDIIKNTRRIQNFYKDELQDKKNDINKVELAVFSQTNRNIICRDIEFSNCVDVKLISRISKKGPVPILYECLPINNSLEDDIFIIQEKFNDNPKFNDDIYYSLYEEMKKRILNFKEKFPAMNRDFMLNAIKYEKDFINNVNSTKNIDKYSILNQLEGYEKDLKNNKMIIQIGRNTNYILKTVGHSFDKEFYKTNFISYFYPALKRPKSNNSGPEPFKLGTMNLVSSFESELYNEVPGYIEIKW